MIEKYLSDTGHSAKNVPGEKETGRMWRREKSTKEKKTKPHSRMRDFVFPWDRLADMV